MSAAASQGGVGSQHLRSASAVSICRALGSGVNAWVEDEEWTKQLDIKWDFDVVREVAAAAVAAGKGRYCPRHQRHAFCEPSKRRLSKLMVTASNPAEYAHTYSHTSAHTHTHMYANGASSFLE